MDAFLTRFYDEVDRNLQSPHSQKRYTKAERYSDLYAIQKRLFESFLGVSGQESNIGRAEIDIELVSGQEFYMLPPGFRQFIAFEKRIDSDPDDVEMKLNTVPVFSGEPGIEIVSAQRGFRVQPVPDDLVAGTWTMIYNRSPVLLHYATAGAITSTTLVAGTPATDCGELVAQDDYYVGAVLRIVSAANVTGPPAVTGVGAGQSRVIIAYDSANKKFTVRTAFDPTPAGTVVYEISPDLEDGYDALYAMDVAMLAASRRREIRRRAGLSAERHEAFQAALSYYANNTIDRAPSRIIPVRYPAVDPYGGGMI